MHCLSESCIVYIKRGVIGVRALGKSKFHSDTDSQGHTQQDLSNPVCQFRSNGMDYVPHSLAPTSGKL